ncbi:MAG: GAF domain-containing sensor histidine kinase [Actinomycetota bacterium]|nr:GAF domain-containing sensor histidine kinase [Actinomycetota bacterium]
MNGRVARRSAVAIVVVYVAMIMLAFIFGIRNGTWPEVDTVPWLLVLTSFLVVGALVISRRPDNAMGWIFSVIALLAATGVAGQEYSQYGFVTRPGSVPAPVWGAWVTNWFWYPLLAGMIVFTPLLFPTGRPHSARWRPVLWVAIAATVATAALAMFEAELVVDLIDEEGGLIVANPIGFDAMGDVEETTVGDVLFGILGACALAAIVSMFFRYRRSRGEERQQLKWFTYAVVLLLTFPLGDIQSDRFSAVWNFVFPFIIGLLPIAAGIAILKYRLYDIDVVINKTVVYGALAGFITLVYVGIVVGIGTVIGQGDRPNLGLSILATAVVAVAFQPVRERVQRFANRLVYGKRATPYEILSDFSKRMTTTYGTEDLLPQMTKILAEGTGAVRAAVWLAVADELRLEAQWPEPDGQGFRGVRLRQGELPTLPGYDLSAPVRDRGELLGALAMAKPRGEALTPTERKLLHDLAAQAGLVLRNVKLIEELRASRQRIVSAQDEERRRIERNIHDGAQQQLVALNVKLGLAKTLAARDAQKTDQMLAQLQSETQEALENLRDLARGIYPPLLRDKGLVAALDAQARKVSVPVEITADGVERYPQEIEAGVYFVLLEALQNVTKYAGASKVTVRLSADGEQLAFEVEDDGAGFDPGRAKRGSGLTNMSDRIEALGGRLEVRSTPGSGTSVRGRVPVSALEPVS